MVQVASTGLRVCVGMLEKRKEKNLPLALAITVFQIPRCLYWNWNQNKSNTNEAVWWPHQQVMDPPALGRPHIGPRREDGLFAERLGCCVLLLGTEDDEIGCRKNALISSEAEISWLHRRWWRGCCCGCTITAVAVGVIVTSDWEI